MWIHPKTRQQSLNADKKILSEADQANLRLEGQRVPQLISAGAQIPQTIKATAVTAFADTPLIQITFK